MKRTVLNLVLVAMAIGLLAANIHALFGLKPSVPKSPHTTKSKNLNPKPSTGTAEYNLNGLRDGFSQPRPPVPPSTSTLLGVVMHGNRKFAIVSNKGKQVDVLEEGSELDAMRIKRIAPKGLVLEGDNGSEKVKVFLED